MYKIIVSGLILFVLTSFNFKNEGNNIIPFSKDSIKLNKSTIAKLESYYAEIKLCDSLKLEKIVFVALLSLLSCYIILIKNFERRVWKFGPCPTTLFS
jgi:hypothetical protein